ncbi:unnamed protein product [Peronospora effusa]|nr:unnamed protein product [Peronospora effusa]
MTTTNVLMTGISLPACCRLQQHSTASDLFSVSNTSYLLPVEILRVNSIAGLSYVVWKCTSRIPSVASSQQRNKVHSQWVSQHQVSIVYPASPDANAALGRGSHDSKFEVDNPRVELWSSQIGCIGRFTAAKQYIHLGEEAFQAVAFAVIVRQSLTHQRCHWCFALLRTKALECGDCAFTRYCSRDCLAADAALHDFQCQALRDLKRKGCDGHLGDVETVRLALAVLSMAQMVRNPQALRLLNAHNEDGDDASDVQHAAEFIVKRTNQLLDRKHVSITLQRVHCNAHPLYLDGVTCVGSGVFPDAAMALNHSCLPNVAPTFNPRTRTLAFHAIVDIPRGYAVECSYIDLLQTRKRRQELLARGFGFVCVCKRCTNEARLRNMGRDIAESEEANQVETRVMEELMQLVNSDCSSVKQRLSCLKKECASFFEHNIEARFTLYTVEMKLASDQNDWKRVIETAEMLLGIWTRCGLPDNYHTTETLHMQIYRAAKHVGMTAKAEASVQRVASIRQICGYSHPDAAIE